MYRSEKPARRPWEAAGSPPPLGTLLARSPVINDSVCGSGRRNFKSTQLIDSETAEVVPVTKRALVWLRWLLK